MSLPDYITEALDQIDAAIFTGDTFVDPDGRKEFREHLARFERGLKEFDEMDKEPEPGIEEGETCNRDGCDGVMEFGKVEGCCCHVSPPCQACLENYPACSKCGCSEEDDG